MKQPKEIWVYEEDGELKASEKSVFNLLKIGSGNWVYKYISEQHHLEQIEVLIKEIDELKERLKNERETH